MSVQETLEKALVLLSELQESGPSDPRDIDRAKNWLDRTVVLLDWISNHPRLVEINCEASGLLKRYRGSSG